MNSNAQVTSSQRAVIECAYSPSSTVKVIAGPGSGKTFTLLKKVHHLIKQENIKPQEILILSLTNKAVDNVKTKLLGIFQGPELNISGDIQEIVDNIDIFTIHGLANKLVVEHEGIINIIEQNGWRGLLKLVTSEFWGSNKISTPTEKDLEMLLKDYKTKKNDDKDQIHEENSNSLAGIINIMETCKVLTNDDLILKASKYLNTSSQNESEFLNKVKNQYKVVLIDEFQDLYPSLLPIIKETCRNKQLIMFGDTNQSIYKFLGSNEEFMRELDTLHSKKSRKTLHLYDNFRSTPEIIDVCKKILPHPVHDNGRVDLIMKSQSTVRPQSYNFNDDMEQMAFIVSEIGKLTCNNVKLSDIAILTRTNNHLNIIAEYFNNYQIPYNKMVTQPEWLLNSKIQFLFDLLKVVVFAHQRVDNYPTATNILHRQSDFSVVITLSALKGIGSKSIQNLYSASIKSGLSLWDYIITIPVTKWPTGISNKNKIIEYANILSTLVTSETLWNAQSPLQVIQILSRVAMSLDYSPLKDMSVQGIQKFQEDLERMFEVMKLCSWDRPYNMRLVEWIIESFFENSAGRWSKTLAMQENNESGKINISTIHSAKGLEYPIVMLLNSTSNQFAIEKNAFYVGATRARNLLYMINMNTNKLRPSVEPNLFSNEQFWTYYNRDLKRPTGNIPNILANNGTKYSSLQKRFGLRYYATRSCTISLYKLLKHTCK